MPTPPFAFDAAASFTSTPILGWSDSHAFAPYDQSVLKTDYVFSQGLLPVPLAATPNVAGEPPNPTQALVNVSAPTVIKVVSFLMTRAGAYPQIPDPTPTNPDNETLIGVSMSPMTPKPHTDGQLSWTISGTYTYALTRPPDLTTEGLTVGLSAANAGADVPQTPLPTIGSANFTLGQLQVNEQGTNTLVTDPGFVPPEEEAPSNPILQTP